MLTGVRFSIAFALAVAVPSIAQADGASLQRGALLIARPALVRAIPPHSPVPAPRASQQSLKPPKLPDRPGSTAPSYNPLVRRHMALRWTTVSDLARERE